MCSLAKTFSSFVKNFTCKKGAKLWLHLCSIYPAGDDHHNPSMHCQHFPFSQTNVLQNLFLSYTESFLLRSFSREMGCCRKTNYLESLETKGEMEKLVLISIPAYSV